MMRTARWMTAILVVIVILAARTPGAQAQQDRPLILVAVPGELGDRLVQELQEQVAAYLPPGYTVSRVERFIRSEAEAGGEAQFQTASLVVWALPTAPTILYNTAFVSESQYLPIGTYPGVTTSPALRLNPGNGDALLAYTHLTVGQAAYLVGRYQEAIVALDAALEAAPENWSGLGELYYYRGIAYWLFGDGSLALENLYNATAAGDVWYYWSAAAWIRFNDADIEDAAAIMGQAIRLSPENVNLYLDRAYFYEQAGDLTAAVEDYRAAIELDPQNFTAYERRAQAYYRLGDFPAALNDYNTLIDDIGFYGVEALQGRAEVYLAMQDYDSALADLDAALAGDSSWQPAELIFLRGLTYLYLQNFDAAIADLQTYTGQHPEDPAGWTNLAQAHEGAGNTFSAIDAYQTALVLDGEATYLYGDLARLYYAAAQTFGAGSVEQANYLDLGIAAAGLALADDPNNMDAHLYRALAYMIRRQNELALEDLNAMLMADPASEDALYNRGIVYTRLGDAAPDDSERQTLWAAAAADYDTLLGIDFDRYNYLLVYQGYLYVQMDAFPAAMDAFAAYDRLYPSAVSTPVDTYFRARAYAGIGDFDRALDAYVTVINGDDAYYACQARLATGLILGRELGDTASGVYHLEHYLERPCTTNPIHMAVVQLYLAAWGQQEN